MSKPIYTRADLNRAIEGARVTTRDEVTDDVCRRIAAMLLRERDTYPESEEGARDALEAAAGDVCDGDWLRDEPVPSTVSQLRADLARVTTENGQLRMDGEAAGVELSTLRRERDNARTALRMYEEPGGEIAKLRAVFAAARGITGAADACDREAERHPSSRSSAPMVRHINAMARLRATLAALDGGDHG